MDGNGVYIAMSHRNGLSQRLNTISNNVANMNTDGFMRQAVRFESHLQEIDNKAVSDPEGTEEAAFPVDRATVLDAGSGPVRKTGNPLDVAVKGDGFLAVQGEDGQQQLTRNGHMTIDQNGVLRHEPSGRPVLNQGGGQIVLPQNAQEVNVARDGSITTPGGQFLGQIGRFRVNAPGLMQPQGDTLYTPTDASGQAQAAGDAQVVQGAVEGSNVNPVVQMTDLIEVQRAYERSSRMTQQLDRQAEKSIRTLGKTS